MTLIESASRWIGEKEIPPNAGFYNKDIEKAMREIGWAPPMAYCILSCKRWAIDAFPERKDVFMKLFSPNVQDTMENFLKGGYKIGMTPTPNTIVLWSSWSEGSKTTKGHAAVCKGGTPNGNFFTIEGNTDAGGGREGDGFYERTRPFVRIVPPTKTHLIVEGFLHL